jgi:hypothetical protein
MERVDSFWRLEGRSDRELLAELGTLVGTGRQLVAEVVAHLGEVEERRLHLDAGCGSMFAYCVSRFGMSEDEACRRIDVARLARRFPGLFPLLANGQVSLSVAALLKPYLTGENVDALLALVSGQSVQKAREGLAACFPRADVASSIRKLPDRNGKATDGMSPEGPSTRGASPQLSMGSTALAMTSGFENDSPAESPSTPSRAVAESSNGGAPGVGSATSGTEPDGCADAPAASSLARQVSVAPEQSALSSVSPPALTLESPRSARIEPLSAGRYRVQFTADAELKNKLELARDLMRHALPSGDLAPIVARALDLLIEQLMKRRFGASGRRKTEHPAPSPPHETPPAARPRAVENEPAAPPSAAPPSENDRASDRLDSTTREIPAGRVDRATRRAVLERDGLRCTWRGTDGVCCNERAWLEHDHVQPRGKGGNSSAANGRLLCRAHNRLAAEREYGRQYIERAIARRRETA